MDLVTVMTVLLFMGGSMLVLSLFFLIKPNKNVNVPEEVEVCLASKDNYKSTKHNIKKEQPRKIDTNTRNINRNLKKQIHNDSLKNVTKEDKKIVKPKTINNTIVTTKKDKLSNKQELGFIEVEKNILSDHQDKIIKLLKNEEVKKENQNKLQETINEIDSFRNPTTYEDYDENDYVQEQDYSQMFKNIINPNIHSVKNENLLNLDFKKEEIDNISRELQNVEIKKLKTLQKRVQLF